MFLTIDPGLGGTGLCVSGDALFPVHTEVIDSKSFGSSWTDRATEIADQLDSFADKWKLEEVYIELPAFFTSAKGASCAAGKNGGDSDLVKLSVLVGRFYELFHRRGIPVEFIRINDWKGQLPKRVVAQRVANRLKCKPDAFPNHVMDAVGMSLHVKNCFSANTGTNTAALGVINENTKTGIVKIPNRYNQK